LLILAAKISKQIVVLAFMLYFTNLLIVIGQNLTRNSQL